MVKTTIIARIADGLPLAASMDDEQVNSILCIVTLQEIKLLTCFYERSKLN